jgi:hypothetical protein
MFFVAVVNVGQTLETSRESFSHSGLALETRAPGLIASWHFEDAIVGEERHDTIEVVRVEGCA